MEDVENRLYLKNLLTCLDGRTKRVLWLRATGYTFKEIGGLLDISSERVRQVWYRGCAKVRHHETVRLEEEADILYLSTISVR